MCSQLLKWTAPGTFSIYTYHGPQREKDPAFLAKYDVVLTTYSTLEYEYRDAQITVSCQYCKRKFKSEEKLAWHNAYFCGPNARMTAGQPRLRGTVRSRPPRMWCS